MTWAQTRFRFVTIGVRPLANSSTSAFYNLCKIGHTRTGRVFEFNAMARRLPLYQATPTLILAKAKGINGRDSVLPVGHRLRIISSDETLRRRKHGRGFTRLLSGRHRWT